MAEPMRAYCSCGERLSCVICGNPIYQRPRSSPTNEDYERVAEGLWALQERAFNKPIPWAQVSPARRAEFLELARAALSAYLEPTTKGDT